MSPVNNVPVHGLGGGGLDMRQLAAALFSGAAAAGNGGAPPAFASLSSLAALLSGANSSSGPTLTPEQLLELLTSAVKGIGSAALAADREGAGAGEGAVASMDTLQEAARQAVGALQHTCGFPNVLAPAARVPLPWPSPEAASALDALARLVEGGSRGAGHARAMADLALKVVLALVFNSPRRVAVVARHAGLAAAVARALGLRGDEVLRDGAPCYLNKVVQIAMPILLHASTDPTTAPAFWRARDTAANLRALAAAYAGAFGALEAIGGAAADVGLQDQSLAMLAAAVSACPDADRRALRAALIAQDGFAEALGACAVRDAAEGAIPAPGVSSHRTALALVLAAALGSEHPFQFVRERGNVLSFTPQLVIEPGARPLMEKLLAAAPSLLEAAADTVIACAPWYAAVTEAVGPGGAGRAQQRRASGAAGVGQLLSSFGHLRVGYLEWVVTLLLLIPGRMLAAAAVAGAGRGSLLARLAPALLAMAEAALAAAGVPPSADLPPVVESHWRGWFISVAGGALAALDEALVTLDDAGASLLDDAALAALVRLSATEPLLLASGDATWVRAANASAIFTAHQRGMLCATKVLGRLCATAAAAPRVAALLEAQPALLAAVGAAVGMVQSERDWARAKSGGLVLVTRRRMPAAAVVSLLATGPASAARGGAAWLSGLAT